MIRATNLFRMSSLAVVLAAFAVTFTTGCVVETKDKIGEVKTPNTDVEVERGKNGVEVEVERK